MLNLLIKVLELIAAYGKTTEKKDEKPASVQGVQLNLPLK